MQKVNVSHSQTILGRMELPHVRRSWYSFAIVIESKVVLYISKEYKDDGW
jgi:hypothetical protein